MKIPLFDIDGTLFKTGGKLHADAFAYAFEKVYGIKATKDDSGSPEGRVDKQIIFEIMKFHGLSDKQIEEKIDEAIACMNDYFVKRKQDANPEVLLGVKELLAELKKNNIPLGLLTGNLEKIAWTKIEMAGLKDYFSFGAFGDNVLKRVELVEVARQNAEKVLKRDFQINDFVIIGDTPRDIACANDAGIKCLIVATGAYSFRQLEEEKPDVLLHTLGEKDKVLEFLNN